MSKSYPGFIDSHMHFLGLGYTQTLISLEKVRSLEELYQTLKDQAHSSFVTARGWNQELFVEKKYPSKDILDVLFPDIPVVLIRVCGHVAVINSAMQS
ncbi:MAG: amidohydrolase family protein, partial [Candidatus Izemoplasmatales bacterium]